MPRPRASTASARPPAAGRALPLTAPAPAPDPARAGPRPAHRRPLERGAEPLLEAGEIEQVAHDPAEPPRLAVHDPAEARDLRGRQAPQREQLAEALERGERRAQLVRGDRDERRLRPVDLLEPRRRARHLRGELVGEAALAGGEPGVLERGAHVRAEGPD